MAMSVDITDSNKAINYMTRWWPRPSYERCDFEEFVWHRDGRARFANELRSIRPIFRQMGIPFTDLTGSGSVNGWRATSADLFLASIIRGRSKRWTPGSAMMSDVGN